MSIRPILTPSFIFLFALLAASRIDQLIPGVWTLELVSGCAMDYHAPIHAVALACPAVDYIRLWPLPITQPWDDPSDMPPGWYAKASWLDR
jgi:hypothetical protein